jgi:23S rRNA (guanine745-N1)-methyltransferase
MNTEKTISTHVPTYWRCPSCDSPLVKQNKQWLCTNKHSFDVAKEGYVNLLLAQHKNSKMPGDSKEMVEARRAFLSQDHYLPLLNHLAARVCDEITQSENEGKSFALFDAGCGEGYYLNTIANYMLGHKATSDIAHLSFYGIDIAKPAIQKAAKRKLSETSAQWEFSVASSFNMPVKSKSQNAVLQVFAPSKAEEVHRILAPRGLWITVNPAGEHLFELKEMVYDQARKHANEDDHPEGFELVDTETIKFNVLLNTPEKRQHLLMMTPFYWTISQEKKEKLLSNLSSTHAHFNITVFRKL